MMKTKVQKSFVAIILALCMVPSLGLLVFGPSEPAANEIAPKTPDVLTDEGKFNTDFFTELTDYVAGRFAFRRECISVWSWLNAKLFHTSVQDQVVIGKNGWLYYSETLDDYRGEGLSEEQLEAAAENLYLMEEYACSCGADFIFTVAPDKNSLYPENMPSYISHNHQNSNAVKIEKYLSDRRVSYVNLFSTFESRGDVLYYATDTHWNAEGAALASDTLIRALGRESSFSEGPFVSTGTRKGDLYNMLIPEGKGSETGFAYGGCLDYECKSNPREGNAIKIETSGGGSGKLKCWRDSFGIELYPYLAASFEEATFSRSADYDMFDISKNYSTVIIELCERNIANLLKNPALYPAPEREMPEAKKADIKMELKTEECSSSGYIHILASLPEDTDCNREVYIVCDKNCYEAAVTLSDEGCGLSACVPAGAEVTGIISSVNGEYLLFPAA